MYLFYVVVIILSFWLVHIGMSTGTDISVTLITSSRHITSRRFSIWSMYLELLVFTGFLPVLIWMKNSMVLSIIENLWNSLDLLVLEGGGWLQSR